MEIGGSILGSYMVCPRQAWLGYHAIDGDKNNEYLKLGTYIHQNAYSREKKEKSFGNSKFDTIHSIDGEVIVGEIKKSSSCLESARMQLAYYLYILRQDGIRATGLLQFPEEKRTEELILTDEIVQAVEDNLARLEKLVNEPLPPKAKWEKYCSTCSYSEICWA